MGSKQTYEVFVHVEDKWSGLLNLKATAGTLPSVSGT